MMTRKPSRTNGGSFVEFEGGLFRGEEALQEELERGVRRFEGVSLGLLFLECGEDGLGAVGLQGDSQLPGLQEDIA